MDASNKPLMKAQQSSPESSRLVNNNSQPSQATPPYSFLGLKDVKGQPDKARPILTGTDTTTDTTSDQPEPVYIDGDIKTFPKSLTELIKHYRRRYNDKIEIPCSATIWPQHGDQRRTLYELPGGRHSEWIIENTSETVHIGRFSWATKRQVIVVQHPDYNDGDVCLIASCGITKIDGASVSQWVSWDPLGESDEFRLILRTVKNTQATNTAQHSNGTSSSGPRKSLIITLKVPGLSRVVGSQANNSGSGLTSQPPVLPRNQLSLASTLHETLGPFDVMDKQRSLSTVDTSDFSVIGQGATVNSSMTSPAISHVQSRDLSAESRISGRDLALSLSGGRHVAIDQTIHSRSEGSITSPTTGANSIPNSNLLVEFIFKEDQQGLILRRRSYSKCKSVQMLYAQAVSAGIADQETTLLFVQVAQQNPRTVVKDDAEDYDTVKEVIDKEIEKIKDVEAEGIKTVEVVIFPFLWSDY